MFSQAGDDAFWRYHDLLFENQRNLTADVLVRLAGALPSVDPAQVRAALADHRHEAGVRADMRAIQDAGVRTPSAFINARMLGAQPFAEFEAAIQRALSNP